MKRYFLIFLVLVALSFVFLLTKPALLQAIAANGEPRCPPGSLFCGSDCCPFQGYDCIDEICEPEVPPPVCGDDICSTGEDPTNCPSDCQICSDGLVTGSEQCDGTNLNGQTCQSQGFTCGILSCTSSCTLDTSGCFNTDLNTDNKNCGTCGNVCTAGNYCSNGQCVPLCGNGIIDSGEQCDGTNLNGQTCSSQGFTGGTLSCTSSCTFNTAQCYNNPKGNHSTSTCTVSTGWACDADNYNQALTVEFYADGQKGAGGILLGSATANQDGGSTVASQCGGIANHAFTFNTPKSLIDGLSHSIYVYGLNIGSGSGVDVLLSNSPKTISCIPPCVLNSASWGVTEAIEGQVVDLGVTTTYCQGRELSFEIKERDTLGFDDPVNKTPSNVIIALDGGTTFTNWTAEWQEEGWPESDPPEYYFKATLVSTGENIRSSNELGVFQLPPPLCDTVVTCADYSNETDCKNDVCSVANNSVPSTVNCTAENTTCSCSWNVNTRVCESSWTITSSPGNETNETTPAPTGIGTCFYTENTTDTCEDDGYLTVDLIATWVWDPGCDSTCQAENQDQALQCQSTTEVLQCPAQIALPFFEFYNFIAALALIAVIYWTISMRRQKKRAGKG